MRSVRIHNEFEAALRRESLLAPKATAGKRSWSCGRPMWRSNSDLLDREVQTARQIYETLLQRVKEAGIATAMNGQPGANRRPRHRARTALTSPTARSASRWDCCRGRFWAWWLFLCATRPITG